MRTRIYYHHTDCGGVVYYANYLNFLEEARTEYLEERGLSIKELAHSGVLFVVSRQEIDYKLPAVYGDILTISAAVNKTTAVRIEFSYEITNQKGQLIALAKTMLVCVNNNFKPQAIPDSIKDKIAQSEVKK